MEDKLAIEFRQGPERVGWFVIEGVKTIRFKIPHIHSSWGKGTISDIVRRSKLNHEEFAALVACPMSRADYEALIRERLA